MNPMLCRLLAYLAPGLPRPTKRRMTRHPAPDYFFLSPAGFGADAGAIAAAHGALAPAPGAAPSGGPHPAAGAAPAAGLPRAAAQTAGLGAWVRRGGGRGG